jgi:hypothetical protein
MQNAECRKRPKARYKPSAGHPLARKLGVALLCSSCVALVSLLFSGGALRRTTAAPSSPKLILTVLVGWLFTCNRIFRQIPCGLPFSVQAAPKPPRGEGRMKNAECRKAMQSSTKPGTLTLLVPRSLSPTGSLGSAAYDPLRAIPEGGSSVRRLARRRQASGRS